MEFALDPAIPNYAGGLGVLATDILRSAADLELPVVGVSLIYHQHDDPKKAFPIADYFEALPKTIDVEIERRHTRINIWEYTITGQTGFKIPIYCLSSFHPDNVPWDRDLTKELYSTNQYTRLCQEAILGIGGIRALRKLGHHDLERFHMNEGHASLLTLERLKEEEGDKEAVKKTCVFTTHTPIPAGHDRFPYDLAHQVLDGIIPDNIKVMASEKELHTTKLALNMSHVTNGVSQKHAAVCHKMFPHHSFLGITNGVHIPTWTTQSTQSIYNQYFKGWQNDPSQLKKALNLPNEEVRNLRKANKSTLIDYVNQHPEFLVHSSHQLTEDDYFDENTLTLTFSRRFVPYKRPLLIFEDLDRLREMAHRQIQVIFSGRCHPDDSYCNGIMQRLLELQKELRGQIRLAVLPNRNLDNTKILVAGSDVWLNNPEPPMEACGTSGMKAALNGGLNFSSPDGWWLEAEKMDAESGFSSGCDCAGHDSLDCNALYRTLEKIIDLYYNQPQKWLQKVKHSIALGAYFNSHRNVQDYLEKMWNTKD